MKYVRIIAKENPKQLSLFTDIGKEEFILERSKYIIDRDKLDKLIGKKYRIISKADVNKYLKIITMPKISLFCFPENIKEEVLKNTQNMSNDDNYIYCEYYRKSDKNNFIKHYKQLIYNKEYKNNEEIEKIKSTKILSKMIAYVEGKSKNNNEIH